MKRKTKWALAAVLIASATAGIACAAEPAKEPSLLDNALNDAAKDKDAAAKPDTAAPPDKPANTGQREVIDPTAAKAVDDADLTKKLTGETPATEGPAQKLDEVVQRMDESAQRLKGQDPGAITQETQRRIVANLDTLIELVKQQQQSQSQQQQQQRNQQAQQRQQNQPGNQPGSQNSGGNTAARQSQLPGGGTDTSASNGQDIRELGKEWGNLPDRDRDLIINGVKEDPLPAYRQAVQQYYKALADINKGTKDNK